MASRTIETGTARGARRVSIGVAVPARDRRNEEEDRGDREQAEGEEARVAVESSAPARDESGAEDEQEVADDATRERPADDLGQPLVHGDQRDDQLGRVPERRVEEAADAGPGVLRCVLGRLADQPRERDEGDRGEHELGRLREVGNVVEDDDEGREPERREEGSPDHGAET